MMRKQYDGGKLERTEAWRKFLLLLPADAKPFVR
jgi:hypothetical protein